MKMILQKDENYNNNIVILFANKSILNLHFSSRYGIFNV